MRGKIAIVMKANMMEGYDDYNERSFDKNSNW